MVGQINASKEAWTTKPLRGKGKDQQMRHLKIVSAAFLAVFAFGALLAASASATQWLKGGVAVAKEEAATTDGSLILVHTGGFGETHIECEGKFEGTVNSGGADLIKLVVGPHGELDLVNCISKSGLCGTGTLVLVHPLNLPWKTQLLLINGVTWDDLLEDGKGKPGWDVVCNIPPFGEILVDCTGNATKSKFITNGASGAEFDWAGKEGGESESCSDGGKAFVESTGKRGTVLNYTVS